VFRPQLGRRIARQHHARERQAAMHETVLGRGAPPQRNGKFSSRRPCGPARQSARRRRRPALRAAHARTSAASRVAFSHCIAPRRRRPTSTHRPHRAKRAGNFPAASRGPCDLAQRAAAGHAVERGPVHFAFAIQPGNVMRPWRRSFFPGR
jgi:hypothetical protein